MHCGSKKKNTALLYGRAASCERDLERREVEKRFFLEKAAVHGYRNLSMLIIQDEFEYFMSALKTKWNIFMNKAAKVLL